MPTRARAWADYTAKPGPTRYGTRRTRRTSTPEWWAYDGQYIRLTQSKSVSKKRHRKPVRIVIPVGAPLKAALDAAKIGKGPEDHILLNSDGQPWTPDGFRSSWRKACAGAGVKNLTFHDLRGTTVTRLAIAGCSEAEIATLTGHSMRDVRTVLDANYLHRDPALARSAVEKLEKGTNLPNALPNGPECSGLFSPKNGKK